MTEDEAINRLITLKHFRSINKKYKTKEFLISHADELIKNRCYVNTFDIHIAGIKIDYDISLLMCLCLLKGRGYNIIEKSMFILSCVKSYLKLLSKSDQDKLISTLKLLS